MKALRWVNYGGTYKGIDTDMLLFLHNIRSKVYQKAEGHYLQNVLQPTGHNAYHSFTNVILMR